MKLPNFLSVETRPFDQETYEDEIDEEETLDEEGRARYLLFFISSIHQNIQNTLYYSQLTSNSYNLLETLLIINNNKCLIFDECSPFHSPGPTFLGVWSRSVFRQKVIGTYTNQLLITCDDKCMDPIRNWTF